MNYITKTNFAEASIELARVKAEGYKGYMMELNSNRFEVRFWRT